MMEQRSPLFGRIARSRAKVAACLGTQPDAFGDTPCQVVSTGVPWLIVPVVSLDAVSRLEPRLTLIESFCRDLGAVGLTVFTPAASNPRCRVRLRTFAPGEGVAEDPVCGSSHGSVAAYGLCHGHWRGPSATYTAEQGVEMGRAGEVCVAIEGDRENPLIRIGGFAARVASGRFDL